MLPMIIKLLFFFPFPWGVLEGIKERKQRHLSMGTGVCGFVWVSCFFLGVSDEPRRKKSVIALPTLPSARLCGSAGISCPER